MLENTVDFMMTSDEDVVVETYSSLFIEPFCEDELWIREEEDAIRSQLTELRDYYTDDIPFNGFIVFATMIPSGHGRQLIPDISIISMNRIDEIPLFMREHPKLEPGDDIPVLSELPSSPLLLMTLRELAGSKVYVPDGIDGYAENTMAAIVYEMTAFGSDVASSDRRKEEISHKIRNVISVSDDGNKCIDELLFSLRFPPSASEMCTMHETLKELEIMRYNARLEIYERMYADIAPILKLRR